MKTLANCSIVEFLVQSNKIRKAVAEYLTETDILAIRKRLPSFDAGVTEEEKKKVMTEQAKKNISDMLDIMLEQNAEGTAKILGLLCFMETKKELESLNILDMVEMLTSERVINFFITLKRLDLTSMVNMSQK